MTDEQSIKCKLIIHSTAAATAGVGAGLAQLPGSDNAVIVPLQIAMIVSLGAVLGMKITESVAASTLVTATATLIGRGISQYLVGWLPIMGNILNAATAAGITEAIGLAVAASFDRSNWVNTHKK